MNRGTYNYQPVYTTPTTAKDDLVAYNLIHDTKDVMHDGGSIYNLSSTPGTVVEDNYTHTVALYLDEGSRPTTPTTTRSPGTGTTAARPRWPRARHTTTW